MNIVIKIVVTTPNDCTAAFFDFSRVHVFYFRCNPKLYWILVFGSYFLDRWNDLDWSTRWYRGCVNVSFGLMLFRVRGKNWKPP